MKIWIRLFFLLIIPAFVYATPVTYVYFGQKWIEQYHADYDDEEKAAFLLGVIFPDIRYLNIRMPRGPDTSNLSTEKLLSASCPFEEGRLFHSFFLSLRNSVVEELDVYERLLNVPEDHRDLLLMLLEDHTYYDEINREKLKQYFAAVIDDEEYTGVPYHTLRTWHRIIAQYYGMSPFAIIRRLRQFELGMFGASKETVAEWSREFPALLESKAFQIYISQLEEQFENHLIKPIDW